MSSKNKKGPIYDPGKCRCCGASKKCRLLNVEYEHAEKKEVYSDMFVECFGLVLSHLDGEETDRLICGMCVARLREANAFRRQVLQCEENLLKTHIHVHGDGTCGVAPMEIKMEVTIKEENEDNDVICCNDTADVDVVNTPATETEVAEGTVNKQSAETEVAKGTVNKQSAETEVAKRTVNKQSAETEVAKGTVKSAEAKTRDDRHKEQLRNRMLRTKERLERMQQPKKPRRQQAQPSRDKFVDEDSLSFHNSVTIVENSFICPFQTSYSSYFCMYCKATFNDPSKLKAHNLKHDPKNFKNFFNGKKATYMDIERIDCRLCDKKITDLEVFKSHITEKHGKKLNNIKDELLKFRLKNGSLSCTECDKKFVFFHALKRHMAEHFGSLVCDVCAAHYFDKRTLEVHFKNAHASEAKYTCHECGKRFKSKNTLHLHVSTVHKTEAAFQCSRCDVALFSNMERFKHMFEVHSESRTYPCESCGREYMNRKNLLDHKRTAHLQRNARASTGGQARSVVATKKINEKRFHCDMCGKSYPRLHYLKLHIQAHNSAASTTTPLWAQ